MIGFLINKIAVKIYLNYRTVLNKTGWKLAKQNLLSFLFNQKLVHIMVVFLTFVLVFSNLVNKTRASSIYSEKTRQALITRLVESDFGSIEEEELIEEFLDETIIISIPQQNYLDTKGFLRPLARVSIPSADEITEEETSLITQEGSAIIKPELASILKSEKPRKETIYYTVETGDTVSTIAEKFKISVNTILWENNLSAYSLIKPGDELTILPVSGITHKVVKGEVLSKIAGKYDVGETEILDANKLADAGKITIGQNLFIPGGRKVIVTRPVSQTNYSSISAIKSVVKQADAAPISNKMNWPTVGARITQYYSWRHQGLDIANKTGTPIYAADAGTVELANWNSGYGYNIVIDHGGGKKTRYAHLSKFYVSAGNKVSKGAAIGEMGSTGWSTGPHLHFEVIINGVKYNPLNYIK